MVAEPFRSEAARRLAELEALVRGATAGRRGPDVAGLLRLGQELLAASRNAKEWGVAGVAAVLVEAARALGEGAVAWDAAAAAALQGTLADLRDTIGPPPENAAGEELPVEVLNFFRIEAGAVLDRVERLVGSLDGAEAGRAPARRRELHGALASLRDMARTFGFREAEALAATAMEDADRAPGAALATALPALRRSVGLETGADAAGASPPPLEKAAPAAPAGAAPASSPPPATTAGPEPTAAPEPDPEDEAEIFPIEAFFYQGEGALQRALELEETILAAASDENVRAAAQEVFDLIRLALPAEGRGEAG